MRAMESFELLLRGLLDLPKKPAVINLQWAPPVEARLTRWNDCIESTGDQYRRGYGQYRALAKYQTH